MNKEDLLRKKAALEEALTVLTDSINQPHYKESFQFKFDNPINSETFTHPTLKMVVSKLRERNLGFVPDLAIQHIEKEALEQFNEIFTKTIRGMNVEALMEIQHELELFEMNDRIARHTEQLNLTNEALDQLTVVMPKDSGVSVDQLKGSVVTDSVKKEKKTKKK